MFGMISESFYYNPCPACQGEGRFLIEGPDHLGRDGNCWRNVEYWEEPCQLCGGSGTEPPIQRIDALSR